MVSGSVDDFYVLSRATLVKDEAYFDRFDLAFSAYFKGVGAIPDELVKDIPAEWLRKLAERNLSEEEKRLVESLGGWDKLMETLRQRLEEQKGRHQGGSQVDRHGRHLALRRLRLQPGGRAHRAGPLAQPPRGEGVGPARVPRLRHRPRAGRAQHQAGAAAAAALRAHRARRRCSTCRTPSASTARNAGWLDLKIVPELHNAVKVLLFLDVGGSMDDHIQVVEELFSAARTEFKNLEHFYFHNCVYESVWKDNHRRNRERIPTVDVMRKYGHDYKAIFVGDAAMSPYELEQPGGSVEHWNDEAGRAVARAAAARLAARRVAQSRARGALGLDRVDGEHPAHLRRAHVPGDAFGTRGGDEGVGLQGLSRRRSNYANGRLGIRDAEVRRGKAADTQRKNSLPQCRGCRRQARNSNGRVSLWIRCVPLCRESAARQSGAWRMSPPEPLPPPACPRQARTKRPTHPRPRASPCPRPRR